MSGNKLLTTAFPIKPKLEKDRPYVYIFLIYLSFVTTLETKIANGIAIKAIKKLIINNFPAEFILSIVKFSIKVPITSAGIKIVFSSLDKTADEFSGRTRNFISK